MLKRKIQKVNKSHLITIPSNICQLMGINQDTVMSIELENKKIIMTPMATGEDHNMGVSQTA